MLLKKACAATRVQVENAAGDKLVPLMAATRPTRFTWRQLYKNMSSRKIYSQRQFSREYDFPKTLSLTENQFCGKTYFHTIPPCTIDLTSSISRAPIAKYWMRKLLAVKRNPENVASAIPICKDHLCTRGVMIPFLLESESES